MKRKKVNTKPEKHPGREDSVFQKNEKKANCLPEKKGK